MSLFETLRSGDPVESISTPPAPSVFVRQPAFPFVPRPPAFDEYRPDTVCDGWTAGDFTVRLASVRGYAHRYRGIPRQDDAAVAAHPATGSVVFAVADGTPNAAQSHIGSTMACHVAIDALLAQLETNPNAVEWRDVLRHTAGRLMKYTSYTLHLDGMHPGRTEELLGTTLILGIVRPTAAGPRVTVVRVGAAGVWVFHHGRYDRVRWPDSGPEALAPLPRLPEETRPAEAALPADGVLLIGTDGFADPLGDGSGVVGALFAGVLAGPPPPLGLAHALDFAHESADEDRTLVAIWPQ